MTKKVKKTREQIIGEAAQNLLKMFETGQMPEAIARTMIRRKEGDDQPSFHWSIGNQILMHGQGTDDARGFNQWKEVGRYVKKGASAVWILAPMTRKITEENEKTGEKEEKTIVTGFTTKPVYRYEDTEGKELERPDYKPSKLPTFWGVAEELGLKVEYKPGIGTAWGSFSPSLNYIKLHTQDVKTFYHELAHAVHNTIKPLKGGQHAEQEIVAETSAAILLQIQGITGFEQYNYEYIEHYIKGITSDIKDNDKKNKAVVKEIMGLLNEIEQVVNIILEKAEELGEWQAIA